MSICLIIKKGLKKSGFSTLLSDVGFLLTEEEINHLYEILGKEEVGYRVKAGVNSPEDIECDLSREVCDTLRKDIEVIKELQEMRK